MTDYIHKKSWWRKNRSWVLVVLVLVFGFILTILTVLGKPIGDFTKAIVDPSVYNNAFDMVQDDERVIKLLGEVQPISIFELLEGEVRYAEEGKAIITVGVKGSKQKGKMDIVANKKNNIWQYQTIRVRTKRPRKIIEILGNK
ncbi:cytochrome c oxidase assembly factor Coa1 family protein [uncultured Aquimarina sp.]|uniref:cytochrome c oxidase assembly factor Coa1 family protein n=1 Tax=uncultured Aquimarina sp. TaxID=575652 RepID=UPI00260D05EC|nr:cytochrome c oxidase assembly factor Coa1 family protein [uncultured Aquimarina sp.]